ncbi:hypothetical protein [Streptomyces niveus]|uniref:hypothetical protein n=1 Tax=Streptomyces niveus TaxID=193462 RepID=UPI003652C65E
MLDRTLSRAAPEAATPSEEIHRERRDEGARVDACNRLARRMDILIAVSSGSETSDRISPRREAIPGCRAELLMLSDASFLHEVVRHTVDLIPNEPKHGLAWTSSTRKAATETN